MSNHPIQRKNLLAAAIGLSAGIGLISPSISFAQLEEVIVTAEKRDTDLQKTATSIQVMDGEQLNAEGKKRIDEIMDGVVGVSSQGSQVGTDFYMRGLGSQGGPAAGGTSQSAVAVLIDGVYQNRGETVRGGTLDVSQVEVMRGTQSTTLGAASLAGAVSLVSNDPVFEKEGSITLGLGNYSLRTAEGVVNLPISDNQAVRIAYSGEKRDGYISSGAGDSDQSNVRIKYRVMPTDDLDIVLTGQHQVVGGNGVDNGVLAYQGYWEAFDPSNYADSETSGCASYYATCIYDGQGTQPIWGLVNDGTVYYDRDNPWDDGFPADGWTGYPFRHTSITTYSADIDWDLSIGTLNIKPSYQETDFDSQEPPRGTSYMAEDRHQETTQLDVQLTSNESSPFEWLGGVYYYDTSYDGYFDSIALGGTTGMSGYTYDFTATNPNEQTTYSAYFNSTFDLLEQLRLNLGIRYSDDKKTQTNSNTISSNSYSDKPTSLSAFEYEYGEGNWSDTTYRIGLEYDLNEETMLYAVFATGYTAGRIDTATLLPNDAETLDQYTLGMKSRFLDNSLQLNIEAFRSEYHDRTMDGGVTVYTDNWDDDVTCSAGTFFSPDPVQSDGADGYCAAAGSPNIPDLLSQGVDIEISWLINDQSRLDFNMEYLDSTQGAPEITLTADDLAAAGDDAATLLAELYAQAAAYDGLTLQNSPEFTANLTYSYDFYLSGGSTLTPKLNMTYSDEYWSLGGGPGADIVAVAEGNFPQVIQEAYEMYNFYLTWVSAEGDVSVNGYVKNIENKAVQTNYGTEAAGYVALKAPRTYGVNLTYNF